MAELLAGIADGQGFTIPAGTAVWPVCHRIHGARDRSRGDTIWCGPQKQTNRDSQHTSYRRLPTDGNFLTFHQRNGGVPLVEFGIAMFENPVRTGEGNSDIEVVGCVVDFQSVLK